MTTKKMNLRMVSALDKSWGTQGTYEDRRCRMIREITTIESKQKGFYERTTQADLYRVSVLTTRKIKSTKRTLGRTSTMRGPLDSNASQQAAIFVTKESLRELADHAKRYSEPFCTVCLEPIGSSTSAVQMILDSWFTDGNPDRNRIWVAFRVCSERCGKKASVLKKCTT